MQHVLVESTSGSAGDKGADSNLISSANRWAKIQSDRSIGRFAVSSTRTIAQEVRSGMCLVSSLSPFILQK
jgi:hypothetical protein